jgi:hypothetical protein
MVYDRVHDAYDGQYDPANDRFTGCRTTFFEEHELVSLADELQSDRESL